MKTSAIAYLGGFALAGALVGCGTDRAVDTDGNVSSTSPGGARLAVFASLSNGVQPADGRFDFKQQAYFNARTLQSTLPMRESGPRDYYFEVEDAAGTPLSHDLLDCRRVTIDGEGRIMSVFAGNIDGVGCTHAYAFDLASGGLTVGLAPFDDAAVVAGSVAASYKLVLVPVKGFAGFASPALYTSFMVNLPSSPDLAQCGNGVIEDGEQCDGGPSCTETCTSVIPPNPAVCGNGVKEDGEECDDGNLDLMDGCNSHCTIEHLCCCGNGEVEPGEQCDDGNDTDGDGCSASCQLE